MLLDANGKTIILVAAHTYTSPDQAAYNLTVDSVHTYYVVPGEASVLVHNSACKIGTRNKARVEEYSRRRFERIYGTSMTPNPKQNGPDWIGSDGKTYDQIGNPDSILHWTRERSNFFRQIHQHLAKADFTVIDLTGFPQHIKDDISNFVLSLPASEFSKIKPIGF